MWWFRDDSFRLSSLIFVLVEQRFGSCKPLRSTWSLLQSTFFVLCANLHNWQPRSILRWVKTKAAEFRLIQRIVIILYLLLYSLISSLDLTNPCPATRGIPFQGRLRFHCVCVTSIHVTKSQVNLLLFDITISVAVPWTDTASNDDYQ